MNSPAARSREFPAHRLLRLSQLERWHFWFRGRLDLLVRLWRKHAAHEAGPVLEVGCGTGYAMEVLSTLGCDIIGLDLRSEGLRLARESRQAAVLTQGSALALPFADRSFGTALLLDTLEHVDDSKATQEIRRVLRPGAKVFISVPTYRWLWSYRDEAAGHHRRYGRAEVRDLLTGAGFEVVEMRAYQVLLFPLVVVTRILGRVLPAARELEEVRWPLLNRLFTLVNRAEVVMGDVIRWPWGSSLLVVAKVRA